MNEVDEALDEEATFEEQYDQVGSDEGFDTEAPVIPDEELTPDLGDQGEAEGTEGLSE